MEGTEDHSVIVVGAGPAGLAASWHLRRLGVEHVVLERDRLGQAWRTRWDSFALVTPNWMLKLPGFAYAGPDPDGFLGRDAVVRHIEDYARSFAAPVREGVTVRSLEPDGDGGFLLRSSAGDYRAGSVIIAAGRYQRPKSEPLSGLLPLGVEQLHSSAYRNPAALPPGAVLVVGSGQSGAQIAEELLLSGRRVYLSVGSAARLPRRYRGRDMTRWLDELGIYDRQREQGPDRGADFALNAHLSGRDGGHSIDLRHLAARGMILLGHLEGVQDGVLEMATDVLVNLNRADEEERALCRQVDALIAQRGILAPPAEPDPGGKPFEPPMLLRLDLRAAQVGSVIWATGYAYSFPWVRFPVFARDGSPVQSRGATTQPGLYFLGLPWLHKAKSGLLYGVSEDAEHVAGLAAQRAASLSA